MNTYFDRPGMFDELDMCRESPTDHNTEYGYYVTTANASNTKERTRNAIAYNVISAINEAHPIVLSPYFMCVSALSNDTEVIIWPTIDIGPQFPLRKLSVFGSEGLPILREVVLALRALFKLGINVDLYRFDGLRETSFYSSAFGLSIIPNSKLITLSTFQEGPVWSRNPEDGLITTPEAAFIRNIVRYLLDATNVNNGCQVFLSLEMRDLGADFSDVTSPSLRAFKESLREDNFDIIYRGLTGRLSMDELLTALPNLKLDSLFRPQNYPRCILDSDSLPTKELEDNRKLIQLATFKDFSQTYKIADKILSIVTKTTGDYPLAIFLIDTEGIPYFGTFISKLAYYYLRNASTPGSPLLSDSYRYEGTELLDLLTKVSDNLSKRDS